MLRLSLCPQKSTPFIKTKIAPRRSLVSNIYVFNVDVFSGRDLFPDFVPLNITDNISNNDEDNGEEEEDGNVQRLVSALIWSNGGWAIFFVVVVVLVTVGVSVEYKIRQLTLQLLAIKKGVSTVIEKKRGEGAQLSEATKEDIIQTESTCFEFPLAFFSFPYVSR